MARQGDLFGRSRRRRVWRMQVIDAGDGHGSDMVAQFRCSRCGTETDWLVIRTVSEAKRGIPCHRCNTAREDA